MEEKERNFSTSVYHCDAAIHNAMQTLKDNKPNDRSERDRFFAIAITDMEKVFAYVKLYIVDTVE